MERLWKALNQIGHLLRDAVLAANSIGRRRASLLRRGLPVNLLSSTDWPSCSAFLPGFIGAAHAGLGDDLAVEEARLGFAGYLRRPPRPLRAELRRDGER